MNQYDEDIIDDGEEDDKDTIIETYTEGNLNEGNPREGNDFVQELAQLEGSCAPDGGYTWCQSKNRCTRPWEEKCPADVCKTPEPKCYPITGGSPPVVTSWAIIARMVTLWFMTPLANRVQSEALVTWTKFIVYF
jgi:hypothetical protein